MAKLFVICGHGAGDSGAVGGGYTEANLVRQLADRLKALGGSDVQVGDTSVNWYASNYIGKGKCPKGVPVIELHMDSASASAKGGHVIIYGGYSADEYDTALAKFISGMFPGRSTTISKRTDLANPKRAARMGVNYRLLECCFISNASDRSKFIGQMNDVARGILSAFGISAGGGSTSYLVRVTDPALNIRKGPGTDTAVVGVIRDKGVYTIVQESSGQGASKWGRLRSGAGWISLDFAEKV